MSVREGTGCTPVERPRQDTEAPVDATEPARPPAGFWRRRVLNPIVALLTQGVTADKVAQTLAVGTVCSLFPFLGTTTALNLSVGLWLRMNQPIMQTLNYLLTPVQLVMIMGYVRLGERLWQAGAQPFTLGDMIATFRDTSLLEFLRQFGAAGLHAFTAWALTAPLVFALVYLPLRPVLRRLARRMAQAKSA